MQREQVAALSDSLTQQQELMKKEEVEEREELRQREGQGSVSTTQLEEKEEVKEREELRQQEGQGSEATTHVEEKENQPLTQDVELVSRHRGQLKRKRDTAHTTAQGMA